MSLREQLEGMGGADLRPVHLSQWDVTVYLRRLSAYEAWKAEKTVSDNTERVLRCVGLCLCDESGAPVWDSVDDAEAWIRRCLPEDLDSLVDAFNEVNGLSETLEDRAGKSEPTVTGGSG